MDQDKMFGRILSNTLIESTQDVKLLKNNILSTSQSFSSVEIDRSVIIYLTKNNQFHNALNYMKFLEEESKNKLHLFLTNQQFFIYFRKRYSDGILSTSEQDLIIELSVAIIPLIP